MALLLFPYFIIQSKNFHETKSSPTEFWTEATWNWPPCQICKRAVHGDTQGISHLSRGSHQLWSGLTGSGRLHQEQSKTLGSPSVWCVCRLSQFSHVWFFVTRWIRLLFPGILQARILQWVAMPSPRGSSQPRDWTCISYVSCTGRQVVYH